MNYFFCEIIHFLDFGHFRAILAVLAIFTISNMHPLQIFSQATYSFEMTEIWYISILVEGMAIEWPQIQKWWNLGHFWTICHHTRAFSQSTLCAYSKPLQGDTKLINKG